MATEGAIKASQKPSLNASISSDKVTANPGWLTIAGQFMGPYLTGQTAAFYAKYPSQASFPAPSVPPADPSETEDCLFLDVKVPETTIGSKNVANKKAPVLVWIYGGGYTAGYKTQYPADSLLAQSRTSNNAGVIFVQLNYRVRPSIHILTCSLTVLKAGRIWIPIRQGRSGKCWPS